uniref:Uncharacterized protein n=1 Tax=Oryza sativa subsp. japonica TaxID=39947 RepID=Q5Z934_ORYSJ|nr:hypothetical protein [Oryza sativa Japonica Group]
MASLKALEPRILASYPLRERGRMEELEASTSTRSNDDDDEDSTQVPQIFGRCWVWGFVTTDLLLMENQIPFFVIQKLFE